MRRVRVRDLWPLALLLFLAHAGKAKAATRILAPMTLAPSKWTDAEMTAFASTVRAVGVDPAIALSVYAFESNLDPGAVNPSSGAQGLAQFMPDTLRGLGFDGDAAAFHLLTVTEQLPWIGKLLSSQTKALGSSPATPAKLMHLQLSPATAQSDVVFGAASNPTAYQANSNLDTSHKGSVDESDLARVLAQSDARAFVRSAFEQLRRVGGATA